MSNSYRSWLYVVLAAAILPSAAGAQTVAAGVEAVSIEAPALPPPLSITKRYVPEKSPRAPLALLIDDSPVVAAAPAAAPVVVEDVEEIAPGRPAIAALAPGRLAITVSTAQTASVVERREPRSVVLFQNGRPLPSVRR